MEQVLRRTPPPDNVKSYDQNQNMLFPPNIRELIEEDHLCLVINDVVDQLDLGCLYNKVSNRGRPLYHPAMMLKVIFYAYAVGIFSSRKIAKAMKDQVPFIFLSAWQKPDFRTISDFRKNNLNELRLLFVQIVGICERLGMISIGHIAIDGTKIKANASDANTYDKKRIEREIKKIFDAADNQDLKEDQIHGPENSGDELPESIKRQSERLKKLEQIKLDLESSNKTKINATDPDAQFMKTRNGIKTAYNAQAAAEEKTQVVVACDVTNQANDVNQLKPMLDQAQENTAGEIEKVSADAGYSTGEVIHELSNQKVDAYIPDKDYQATAHGKKKNPFIKAEFAYDEERDLYVCPEGCELPFSHLQKRDNKDPLRVYQGDECVICAFFGTCTKNHKGRTITRNPHEEDLEQMRSKLDSQQGKAIYSKRKEIIEPVFGQIKHNIGFTGFMLRGLEKVKGEFSLICSAFNLKKISKRLSERGKSIAESMV